MVKSFYIDKLADLQKQIEQLQKQSDKFSRIRLIIFLISIAICFCAFTYLSTIWGIVSIPICLFALVYAVQYHRQIENKVIQQKTLEKIYKNELAIKTENIFGNGKEYVDDKHAYSSDLDLFGEASVFEYINRTVTHEGNEMLANFLQQKASEETIIERHAIIVELSKKELFKEKFLSAFFLSKTSSQEESRQIHNFITQFSPFFLNKKMTKVCAKILPVILLSSFVLGFLYNGLWAISILTLLAHVFIALNANKKVVEIDDYVAKNGQVFFKYSQLMKIIKSEEFTNNTLCNIKNDITQKYRFDNELIRLSKLAQKLEYRKNGIVGLTLNALFLWDIHFALAIEKWFVKNRAVFVPCLESIGQMDAYLSLSIIHFNHPHWIFPTIDPHYFSLKTVGVEHPLIEPQKSVDNNFELKGNAKVDIITGSNMAGKSTFLRTLGVNMVLAFMGAPVCAKEFRSSLVDIFTYMHIRDSLNENTSSFYAELLRMKQNITEIEKNKHCFLLLDELLRGTNSKDKYIGSVAIVKNLIKNNTVALVATHDLELTKMQNDYPNQITNYHFDISVKEEDFFFDYKLKEGICHNFNATLLMKKIGIEVETSSVGM